MTHATLKREMDQYTKQLKEEIPDFGQHVPERHSELDISGTVSVVQIHGWKQILGIVAVAVIVIGCWEVLVRAFEVPKFVFPTPSAIVVALVRS